MDTFWRWHGALQGNRVVENRFDSGEPKNRPWYFANNPCSRWSVRRLCLCIRLSHRCGLHKIIYIGLVCKHGAAPRKKAVTCSSHHRQGISPSADIETWIDFEKTCGTDRFWKGVPELPRVSAGVLFFIFQFVQPNPIHRYVWKTGIILQRDEPAEYRRGRCSWEKAWDFQEVSGEDGESRYHFEFSLTVSVLYDTIFI